MELQKVKGDRRWGWAACNMPHRCLWLQTSFFRCPWSPASLADILGWLVGSRLLKEGSLISPERLHFHLGTLKAAGTGTAEEQASGAQ